MMSAGSEAAPAAPRDAQSPATDDEAPQASFVPDAHDAGAASAPEERELEVNAPLMAATVFPSWDAFFDYFAVYQHQTFQVYMSKSSTSWSTRNQRLLSEPSASITATDAAIDPPHSEDASQARSPAPIVQRSRLVDAHVGSTLRPPRVLPLVPEAVGVYAKTLACTHSGKPRSRSQGIRQRHQFRSMQCPAKVNLVVKKLPGRDARDASAWQVVVTRHVVTHNHPLDAETYMQYPQNRRVDDPHVLETVDALSRAGVKQRQIRDYLAQRAPNKLITNSDVHNMLAKMKRKRRRTGESAAETLTALAADEVERSGGFRLRVSRLEEQNLALYEENVRLRLANTTQAQQLQEAHVLIAQLDEQIARLTASKADDSTRSIEEDDGGDPESAEDMVAS